MKNLELANNITAIVDKAAIKHNEKNKTDIDSWFWLNGVHMYKSGDGARIIEYGGVNVSVYKKGVVYEIKIKEQENDVVINYNIWLSNIEKKIKGYKGDDLPPFTELVSESSRNMDLMLENKALTDRIENLEIDLNASKTQAERVPALVAKINISEQANKDLLDRVFNKI